MISLSRKDLQNIALLLGLCGVLYFFNLGGFGFFDPDEPFYAMTAKEMLLRHDWSTPFLFGAAQFEKPPLTYWVVASFFNLFGINEFAARLGPAIAGTLTVLVTYLWGLCLFKRRQAAFLGALILATSGEFIVLSRIILTDMFLTLFVTAALFCFTLGLREEKCRKAAWNALFLFSGLGVLTKGPLGFIVPFSGIFLYLIFNKEKGLLRQIPWLSGLLIFSAVTLPWYGLMTQKCGPGFLEHFFIHENVRRFFVTEHESLNRFIFYPFMLLVGFLPWSLLIPGSLLYLCRVVSGRKYQRDSFLLLLAVIAAPLAFFSAAQSKLPSYIFPVFPPLALLTGAWLCRYKKKPVMRLAFGVTGGVLLLSFLVFGVFLPKYEPLYSSKPVSGFFKSAIGEKSPAFILCNKMNVRGVYYYTQADYKKIGVLSSSAGAAFYTKHSIPIIDSKAQLLAMKSSDFPIYCFLRPKELKFLGEILDGNFAFAILRKTPQVIVGRLERNDHL